MPSRWSGPEILPQHSRGTRAQRGARRLGYQFIAPLRRECGVERPSNDLPTPAREDIVSNETGEEYQNWGELSN